MGRFYWDVGEVGKQADKPFEPNDYRELVKRLARLSGVELTLHREQERPKDRHHYSPVRLGRRRTGWGVSGAGSGEKVRRAAELAADLISSRYGSDNDSYSMTRELLQRYEEITFLYDMGEHVGALLDEKEICTFVIEEAASLMKCDRASIMVPDPQTGDLKVAAAVGLEDDIAREVSVAPGEGVSGRVFASGRSIIVNEGDPLPSDSLRLSGLADANCFLSAPLKIVSEETGEEEVVGVFNLTRKLGNYFLSGDLRLITTVAATAATQIHNCRLLVEAQERQRLEHELDLAARIQLSLLPKAPASKGQVEVAGHCRLARRVGGDLFDYWERAGNLCIVVADVAGHDMGAALMATALRTVLRSETTHHQSVSDLMDRVNRSLFQDLCNSELFISVFYGELDPESCSMTYCRAGHPLPLLVRGERDEWLDTEGILFGIQEDAQFEQKSIQLTSGDTILFYTDGLVEAADENDKFFGTERICHTLRELRSLPAEQAARRMVEAAQEHLGSAPVVDDMTAMVLRVD